MYKKLDYSDFWLINSPNKKKYVLFYIMVYTYGKQIVCKYIQYRRK